MASKEIIEVGSSDEEAEPPPKKRKPEKKRVPNAMVHIPSRLPGISIKPAKKSTSTLENNPTKSSVNKNTTQKVTNVASKSNLNINPLVNKLKNNSVTIKKASNTVVFLKESHLAKHQPVKKPTHVVINTLNLNKNMPNVQIKRVKPQGPKPGSSVLSNLPSSITIKKSPSSKPVFLPMPNAIQKNIKTKTKAAEPNTEITIVDLDDDEVADQQPPAMNPQWYMRPEDSQKEDQTSEDDNAEDVNFEEQNNKEPETPKYVEITIEDSPIKPAERHFNEIGKELPVIIEDSPCKNKNDGGKNTHLTKERSDPHSRKKLNYPKERQVVEIEIDPIDTSNTLPESNEKNIPKDHPKEPHKNIAEKCETILENENPSDNLEQEQEFHPTYQKFIETCFEIENSDDMKKIVEKKIKAYYRQCPKEYVESEEFLDMVCSKTASIKAGPDKMYLFIKDVVDELNLQRKLAKTQETKKDDVPKVAEQFLDVSVEDGEYDTKRSRQIRKLEKTIKKLHRAIQKLEEQEVDLDDEENSMYLLTERYKERLIRVHAKFRQMTNTKMPSEPRIVIECRSGCPQGPTKRLEKFINKKVPIGAPLPFPDFHDVLRCVREANEEDGLGWSNMEIEAEARDLFERCGKKLKRRRQENEWRISVASRIQNETQEKDPAEDNPELKQKLCENKLVAAKRESEVLKEYADRQHQLKLEAEEIEDKEAEESVDESEEEEAAVSHLENKQKRKEILKKLIQESNRKISSKNADVSSENAGYTCQNTNREEQTDNNGVVSGNGDKLEGETKITPLESMDVDSDNNSNDNKEKENNVIDIDSDIDELHLLQKLRFEDERVTSSSDSDESAIAISDSSELESDGENDKKVCSDIISIENSSYSESEALPEEAGGLSNVVLKISSNDTQAADLLENTTPSGKETSNKTNDGHARENISLVSSRDGDAASEKDVILGASERCTNLIDNILSITNTVTEGGGTDKQDTDKIHKLNENKSNKTNEEETPSEEDSTSEKDVILLPSSETCTNLKENALSSTDAVMVGEDIERYKDTDDMKKVNKNESNKTNEEDTVENILLASSEEDATSEKDLTLEETDTCTNLQDDVLSLSETVVGDSTDHIEDVDKIDKVNQNELKDSDKDRIKEIQSAKVNQNELKDSDKEKIKEIQSANGDCTESKDVSERVTMSDKDTKAENSTDSEQVESTDR